MTEPFPTPKLFRVMWPIARRIPTRYGSRVRKHALTLFGANVCAGAEIGPGVRVLGPRGLQLGEGSSVARDVLLDARAGLDLQSKALIGFEAVLVSWTHEHLPGVPVIDQGFTGGPITVGSGAWLGVRAVVLPGRRVGNDARVGAGAVVTRDVVDGATVGGIPAVRLKSSKS